jgi:hypothetical protein
LTDGTGVFARSGTGNAVYARTSSHDASGVYGENVQDGYGVAGRTGSGSKPATLGDNTGAGRGVLGVSAAGAGVAGLSHGIDARGNGVEGRSDAGRGGRFSGKKAQIKLDPSTAATHPASGAVGDIFLDASKRLWLCKGGTSWVRLDT